MRIVIRVATFIAAVACALGFGVTGAAASAGCDALNSNQIYLYQSGSPTINFSFPSFAANDRVSVTFTTSYDNDQLSYSFNGALAPGGSGSIPINGSTGAITFTVTNAGIGGVVVSDQGSQGYSLSYPFSCTPGLSLNSTASATTQVGQSYSQTNVASNGTSPYTYSIFSGTVPAGTALNTSTGTVSGTPTTAGAFAYTVKVSSSDSQTATQVVSGTIAQGANTISFPTPSNTAFTSSPPTLSATASSGLAVSYASNSAGICTVTSGGALTFVSGGTCSITAAQAGNANYATATSVTDTFTVNPGTNTITFPTPPNTAFTSPPPTLNATATSGLTVSYTSNSAAVCTVTSGGALTFVSGGTCSITASQAGNANYAAATSVTDTFTVTKGANTITFATPPGTAFTSPPPTLNATATSGLTVSYTSNSAGVCTVTSGGTIAFVSGGTCSITASQAGNASYAAATSVTDTFTISQGANTISFPTPPNTAFTSPPPTLNATASSGLAVSYASNSAGICTVTSGGALTFVSGGTCSITASQPGNASYVAATSVTDTFTVNAGANTISFPTPSNTAFTNPPPTLGATASSGLAVSYTSNSAAACTVTSGGTITFVSAGTCSITAAQPGNASYAAATPVTDTFTITPGANTISFPTPPNTAFTSPPPTLSATASSGLAVSYASNSAGICTVTSGGTITFVSGGTCSITASQVGNTNYTAATPVTDTFTVTAGANTITFPTPSTTAFTSPPPTLSATASSGLAVSYATNSAGVCSVTSGGTIAFVSAGTCSLTASQAGNGSYAAATPVTDTFIVTPGVNTISLPTIANVSLTSPPPTLTATASSGLTVTYSSNSAAVCTVTPGGAVTLVSDGTCSITASQAGNSSYAAANPVTQTFSVTQGAVTVALASSLNPSQANQAVTFRAGVTSPGNTTPTGNVSFFNGGVLLGTATVVNRVASFTVASFTIGSHSITATYSGDNNFKPSTSAPLIQAVNTPNDSLKLRAMQVLATTVVAQNSGQAIASAVDSAITDGFSDGGNFVTPGGSGMHFNFTSDPDEQNTASPENTISDRWNGTFRSDASNGASAAGAGSSTVNSYARNQLPSRVDDAFAAIDRNAMATKARARIVEPKEWMLWADVRGSGINRWDTTSGPLTQVNSPTLAALYGSQVNALMGLTRKFNPSFLVGAFGGYETFDYRSDALEGRLKGEGWTVGSYLGWKLSSDIRFTAAAAYSGITYNGSAGTATGNFDGDRWLLSSGLTGNYHMRLLEIEPSAMVYALWEHENAYTDSLGTAQDDRTFFTGRASAGAKLAYPIAWTSTVTLAPYVGLYGDYYFNGDDAAIIAAAGSVPVASTPILDGWSARFTGGLAARLANGSAIAFGAELGGIGSSTQIWTFLGRGSIPF